MAPINQVLCVGVIFAGLIDASVVGWIMFGLALVAEVGFALLSIADNDEGTPPPNGGGKVNW